MSTPVASVVYDLHAQAPSSSTIERQAQLNRGEDVYFSSCVECHNSDLSGGSAHSAPALAGSDFRSRWSGRSARELLERTRLTMPQDQPKSLSNEAYLDVTAFVLRFNKIDLGDTLFDEQAASHIVMN